MCVAVREDLEIVKLGLHKNMKAFGTFQVTNSNFTKIKLQRFTQHAGNPGHAVAESVVKFGKPKDEGAAPSGKEWSKVYDAMINACPTGRAGVDEVGGPSKVRRMQWCLAESQRRQTM